MAAVRLKIMVAGIVQGVGFRPFIYRIAVRDGLTGYVKNKGDAGVEIIVEGDQAAIERFIHDLKNDKPPLSRIYKTTTTKLAGEAEHKEFTIHKSSDETELSGSTIPPDVAICHKCLKELKNTKDPRHNYFFITCTNCGPRFTIIEKLPYDRENTTMRDFAMCSFCQSEYADPSKRRFQGQTVACPRCGPEAYLVNSEGRFIEGNDPIRKAGKLLSEGKIVAIKGYGGFHLAASTTNEQPLLRLREAKHRSQKPFAIMARSVTAIETFANISKQERELLTSYTRPVVLLNKSSAFYLSDLIAPGLHNVGVMLPYTGLHYLLFDDVEDASFVMTSANPPNRPITKGNEEALSTLGSTVDYFLLHDRKIAHRCDDSVVRMHRNRTVFLRRSRGYAPVPLSLPEKAKHCVLGLGGELSNTSCVLLQDKVFVSQHIGDVESVETKEFLEEATKHLVHLTNSKIELIACDLHPKFVTTHLALEWAEENDWQLLQVQHHYAHAAGLMLEHGADELVGICCDGYGYGTDGQAWGGEVLACTREPTVFKRVAHLEKQPLLGGDLATRYPLRMAAGILQKEIDLEPWLMERKEHFPHGEEEIRTIMQQLSCDRSIPQTTSCGRILDAASAILDTCFERTYEGEPAMKLESLAKSGKNVLGIEPIINGDTLQTTQMLYELVENRNKYSRPDLANSAHFYLSKGLAQLAVEKALENGIKSVGFSGGAACNELLVSVIRKNVEDSGLKFLVNKAIPPGDGGISFGQAVVGGFFRF
jgi:hydrogenase maturation protein HypF